eukprot:TRINITY_DN8377_c0_g1_i1.p1 TRINITY_DN8377_c0_g1~~TRINITY_DN8377_c0_g1_i1.p1  ORF type:complete len:887 (+),score=161.99 TRINITY_DN8377_c0_g1_i1:142-2661(+)
MAQLPAIMAVELTESDSEEAGNRARDASSLIAGGHIPSLNLYSRSEVRVMDSETITAHSGLIYGAVGFVGVALMLCLYTDHFLAAIASVCVIGGLGAVRMAQWVLNLGEGSDDMIQVGNAIREGSEAYLRTMFGTIAKLLAPAVILILCLACSSHNFNRGFTITLSFAFGAVCSSLAGIVGMWSSTRANIRVAQTACEKTQQDTIVVALRSGAVAGITVVGLAVFGISFLFALSLLIVDSRVTEVPESIVGYGFGASFVAMFAQLGGGIFTKAADVGADLSGKIEMDIPEDDPRNPAVIADLVGDNVGDCCARGADIFESLAAEIIAAMILGGSLAKDAFPKDSFQQKSYVYFPLVVHVIDLVASTVGVLSVAGSSTSGDSSRIPNNPREILTAQDPLKPLLRGYAVAIVLAFLAFMVATGWLLGAEEVPNAASHFVLCGLVGMLTGFLVVFVTQYYTDFKFWPVRSIATASEGGHGTNVIAGLAVGMESTMLPVLIVSAAILTSYYLGRTVDFGCTCSHGPGCVCEDEKQKLRAGLFGTAVATMGMLSNVTYVLAMDVFGPIVDNAAGIVEMSADCPAGARETMDRLDAVGNTTKAFTKGFAVSSAGLACFLLFRAFLDVVEAKAGIEELTIDAVQPEIFVAGIIGAATVYLFSAYAMQAVGRTAEKVVAEVRRQFREFPGILTRDDRPAYGQCVRIVSNAAIGCMVKPGLLIIFMPILIGGAFRIAGNYAGDKLMGAKAMTSYLVSSSMTAILMALFLNNGGGAWDNAKKYVEAGAHGGKGSDAHKAAVTGDTVGDPCKDTAGPSLHVLMKLTATVTMVVGPIVVLWDIDSAADLVS